MVEKNNLTMIIIIAFIGAIIGIVFMESFADSISLQTSTVTISNGTITSPAVSTPTAITGRDLIGSGVVYNGTNLVPSSNVTISDGLISGVKTVIITVNNASFAAIPLNVSYTYGPDGYLQDSGSRSISLLILVFSALAILIFVIVVILFNDKFRKILGF